MAMKRPGHPRAWRDQRLSLDQTSRLSRARILGSGRETSIHLDDSELIRLLSVIVSDNKTPKLAVGLPSLPRDAEGDYYRIPLSWFAKPAADIKLIPLYIQLCEQLQDFETYFECLCELHKRRKKYAVILTAQPLPKTVQISPRSLLEFGGLPVEALASWMTWRKWFFDIDNRAGQETGYLFEPILTKSLGGNPYSAKRSPIRRAKDGGKGRQVDCIVGLDAYEFKLRVTIAASGQGRFGQELEFADDCRQSGYRPVLLVLDPTPNPRLSELVRAFERHGGEAHIGDAAWGHIEDRAGQTMARSVERYVRHPIAQLDRHATTLLDLFASATLDRSSFTFRLGDAGAGHEWTVARLEDESLVDESGSGDELL